MSVLAIVLASIALSISVPMTVVETIKFIKLFKNEKQHTDKK